MNSNRPPRPDWHPDEIGFLKQRGVITDQVELPFLDAIKQRWIHHTLREVFLSDRGFVLKRYSHFPGRKDYRRVWNREHRALSKLQGLPVPQSMGFVSVKHQTGISGVLYLRTLLPGKPVAWESDHQVSQLPDLLAAFHRRGVVTLDPQRDNFILTGNTQQTLGFIDFGRSRVFSRRSLLMLINLGKEFSRLTNEGGLSPEQMAYVLERYRSQMAFSSWQSRIFDRSFEYWQRRHARKSRNSNG